MVGPGGAGKSTVAAALATRLRRRGARVVLTCLDGRDPATLLGSGADLPEVVRLDAAGLVEERYRTLAALAAGGHDHGAGPSLPDAEELTGVPVAETVAALAEVVRLAERVDVDHVVVDGPSAGEWVDVVATPASVAGYLDRIWPQHARVVAATGGDLRAAVLVQVVDRIVETVTRIGAVLGDADRTDAVVVAGPRGRSIERARDVLSLTVFHGVAVSGVVIDGVQPDLGGAVPTSVLGTHPAVYWAERRRAEHLAAVRDAERFLPGVRLDVVTEQPGEPVGSTALAAVADEIGDVDPCGPGSVPALTPQVEHESGTGLDSVYVMRVPLPYVDASTVAVGRVEDDMIVSAQGARRRLRLASVLRRCTVVGAAFDEGVLTVRFTPDAAVWPENLAAPPPSAPTPGTGNG
ncbi:ArsA family ATPase [Rhodococcoides corynebacterioides]|uniref:ArsA family ATPase n=1 Tax=Rhodococcoides corynebacterioides TaxID=53972 RepID=UPI001C9B5BB4|nr:ArsA-related P-loop ATPase [Rhodococcus corynebacterioides]MBY6362396.1 ArsA family ATPase [Rhodococcus corynebacterioides]